MIPSKTVEYQTCLEETGLLEKSLKFCAGDLWACVARLVSSNFVFYSFSKSFSSDESLQEKNLCLNNDLLLNAYLRS